MVQLLEYFDGFYIQNLVHKNIPNSNVYYAKAQTIIEFGVSLDMNLEKKTHVMTNTIWFSAYTLYHCEFNFLCLVVVCY